MEKSLIYPPKLSSKSAFKQEVRNFVGGACRTKHFWLGQYSWEAEIMKALETLTVVFVLSDSYDVFFTVTHWTGVVYFARVFKLLWNCSKLRFEGTFEILRIPGTTCCRHSCFHPNYAITAGWASNSSSGNRNAAGWLSPSSNVQHSVK